MVEKNLNDEDALAKVIARYTIAKDYRSLNYDERWDAYHKQYRSKINEEKNMPYMAQLFIPYSFTAVETVIPRIVEAIFSTDPIVAVKPTTQDDIERAKINEMLLNWQLKNMGFFDTMVILSKMCLVYGTCIAKVDWKQKIKHKYRINPLRDVYGYPVYDENGKIVTQKEEYDVVLYDDPYIYPVDIYKFFIQPGALSIDEAEYVICVTETTIEELEQLEKRGVYKNINKVKDIKGSTRFDMGRNRYVNVNLQDPSNISDKYSNKVLLYEYWEDNRVIVVAEEKVVIRNEENPYWHCRKPFVAARICPVENEFYGIGLMEMVESLQAELNDIRNQRLDNVKLALNKMFIVARDADVDVKKLVSEPGGVIPTNYVEGVRWMEVGDITASAYTEAKLIVDDIQTAHGIYDYSKGATPKQRETATGILSLQEAANIRFKLMIMILLKSLLNPAVEIMNDLNQQFITAEKVLLLTGQQFERIENIDEIAGRYDYEPLGASLEGLSKYARTQQIINARQILASNPNINISRLDRDILELMDFKNPDEYFYQPQQINAMAGGQQGMLGENGQIPMEQLMAMQGGGQMPQEMPQEVPQVTPEEQAGGTMNYGQVEEILNAMANAGTVGGNVATQTAGLAPEVYAALKDQISELTGGNQ